MDSVKSLISAQPIIFAGIIVVLLLIIIYNSANNAISHYSTKKEESEIEKELDRLIEKIK
jgi:hypothetical protein